MKAYEDENLLAWVMSRISYDKDSGTFEWLSRPPTDFSGKSGPGHGWWEKRKKGNRAGALVGGYIVICITHESGVKLRIPAHRLALAITTGAWPVDEVDHIDGNRANNSLSNLRAASREQNSQNRGSDKRASSKFKGVSRCSRNPELWLAQISGKNVVKQNLGRFETEKEAAKAYDIAASFHFGKFARLNFPTLTEKGRK